MNKPEKGSPDLSVGCMQQKDKTVDIFYRKA